MRLTTDGLIIREKNIKDDQRLVVALTKERGLITAYVSGVRRMKSRTSASTQLLCYSNLTFFKNRGTYRVDEADLQESFFSLRQDIEKLSLAGYFCELGLCLAPEEEEAEGFLQLMLTSLYYLSNGKRPAVQIKSVMELRMLSMAGYLPHLIDCGICGNNEGEMSFDPLNGRIVCANCTKDPPLFALPMGVLTAMRHIIYADMKKLFAFTLSEIALEILSQVSERYTLIQTDRTYKSLEFYKSLFHLDINS